PKLYPLVMALKRPPEMNSSDGYISVVKRLPDFGKAGVPLIAAQLQGGQGPFPHAAQLNAWNVGRLMQAHAGALAKLAAADDAALNLLLTLPQAPLAASVKQKDKMLKNLDPYEDLLKEVGNKLASLGKEQPQLRKSITPYFSAQLQSKDIDHRL